MDPVDWRPLEELDAPVAKVLPHPPAAVGAIALLEASAGRHDVLPVSSRPAAFEKARATQAAKFNRLRNRGKATSRRVAGRGRGAGRCHGSRPALLGDAMNAQVLGKSTLVSSR